MSSAALVVEDNVVIGLDVEDMLLRIGFAHVEVAASNEEALRLIREQRFDFAVLDVNLGPDETSIPTAALLMDRAVPFVFATGYGDAIARPDEMAHVQVLKKPYFETDILSAARKAGALLAHAKA